MLALMKSFGKCSACNRVLAAKNPNSRCRITDASHAFLAATIRHSSAMYVSGIDSSTTPTSIVRRLNRSQRRRGFPGSAVFGLSAMPLF